MDVFQTMTMAIALNCGPDGSSTCVALKNPAEYARYEGAKQSLYVPKDESTELRRNLLDERE